MSDMTDLQRELHKAWFEAERAVAHLIGKKPVLKDGATETERETYRDAAYDWREEWQTALGFRDGMRKACVIAKVPNFTEE